MDIEIPDKRWDRCKIVKLIKLYEKKRILWDTRHVCYRSRSRKSEAIMEIAKELDTNSDEVSRKLNSILTQYRREKILLNTNGIEKVPWFAYKYLKFLDGRMPFHKGTTPQNILKQESSKFIRDTKSIQEEERTAEIEMLPNNDKETRSIDESNDSDDILKEDNLNEMEKIVKNAKINSNQFTLLNDNNNILNETYNLMKNTYDTFRTRDELKIFAEMIEHRLRKLKDKKQVCILKHDIENLLFKAEIAEFNELRL